MNNDAPIDGVEEWLTNGKEPIKQESTESWAKNWMEPEWTSTGTTVGEPPAGLRYKPLPNL